MAVLQSTYSPSYPVGYPGMVANGETSNRLSRTVEDVAGIPFGRAVFRGVGDHGVTATPAAGTFMGITISNISIQPLAGVVTGGLGADIYPQYSTAGLLNEGEIWVTVGANVNDGDPAYVTSAGVITNVGTSNTAIPAVFDDTVTSGGLSRLRVRRA